MASAIIVGVLIFVYDNNANTNSAIKNQQPSTSNPIAANTSTNTTGKHFFVGVNENVKITTNP